jgi:hypothetical protein
MYHVSRQCEEYWLPTPFASFPFTSPPVRHHVPSRLNWTLFRCRIYSRENCALKFKYHHHHHHVQEGLGVFPVPWSSKWNWSLHLLLGRPMFLRPFGLYCNACFGNLFVVSILCTCCSHFSWYFFISFTIFSAPVKVKYKFRNMEIRKF